MLEIVEVTIGEFAVGPFAGLRKMRMGDYRIIYVILDKDVVILRIGNRREIYK